MSKDCSESILEKDLDQSIVLARFLAEMVNRRTLNASSWMDFVCKAASGSCDAVGNENDVDPKATSRCIHALYALGVSYLYLAPETVGDEFFSSSDAESFLGSLTRGFNSFAASVPI